MEGLQIGLDSAAFDAVISGKFDLCPLLPDFGDVSIFAKPKATEKGNGAVVITFTVRLPDGSLARAQTVVTAALFEAAGRTVKAWREGGHI